MLHIRLPDDKYTTENKATPECRHRICVSIPGTFIIRLLFLNVDQLRVARISFCWLAVYAGRERQNSIARAYLYAGIVHGSRRFTIAVLKKLRIGEKVC